jgi:hypothetical protein
MSCENDSKRKARRKKQTLEKLTEKGRDIGLIRKTKNKNKI